MKIPAIKNYINFKAQEITPPAKTENTEPEKEQSGSNNKVLEITLACLGGATLIGGSVLALRNKKTNKVNEIVEDVIDEALKKFPEDIEYRKKLLKALNIPETNVMSLRSIIGAQEYGSIVKSFNNSPTAYTPGTNLITKIQDDYILDGVYNNKFRISLHNHTIHSDGKMTVEEFLNQSAKYADDVARANANKSGIISPDAPFTIAITDHDTVEGCKEAVRIISSNPQKYENLRLVLGTELTVEDRMLSDSLQKPVQIHMVVNCINPFDEKLNRFLEGKKQEKIKIGEIFFKESKDEIAKTDKALSEKMNFEDAKNTFVTLKNGLIYPWYYVRDYAMTLVEKSKKDDIAAKLNKLAEKYEPKMTLPAYASDMEETINLIRELDSGYMTLAHPALTNIAPCLKNRDSALENMSRLIYLFKIKGGERALSAEVHYPYFGDISESLNWVKSIEKYVKDCGLLASGGQDSHGKSIFYGNK